MSTHGLRYAGYAISLSQRCSPLKRPLHFSKRTPKLSLIKKKKNNSCLTKEIILSLVCWLPPFLLLLKSPFFFLNKGSHQGAVYVMAKGMDSAARFPGFESWIWSWTSCSTSVRLHIAFCKMEMIPWPSSQHLEQSWLHRKWAKKGNDCHCVCLF